MTAVKIMNVYVQKKKEKKKKEKKLIVIESRWHTV